MDESSVPDTSPARPGIQSVEVAAAILRALADSPGAVPLRTLAAAANMPAAKVHRYLVSLTRTGLVEQQTVTGHYGIGELSLALGLRALGQIDVIRIAWEAMPGLRDAVDETVVLAVWGDRGPTIVRFEESSQPVTLNVRVGSVLPILPTALGRVFAAFSRSPGVAEAAERERRRKPDSGAAMSKAAFAALLGEVRERGLARIAGDQLPGISALAAPVFDHGSDVAAALGVLGRQQTFDIDWNGRVAAALRETARGISSRMGYVG